MMNGKLGMEKEIGNGKPGTENGHSGQGTEKVEPENKDRRIENGKQGTGNGKIPHYLFK